MTPQITAASTVVAPNFHQIRGFFGALGAFPGAGVSSDLRPGAEQMIRSSIEPAAGTQTQPSRPEDSPVVAAVKKLVHKE